MKNDLTTGAWQHNIGCPISITLLSTSDVYTTYKLTYVDALGHLEYIGDIVIFLLFRIDGERSEQVKHDTAVVKDL